MDCLYVRTCFSTWYLSGTHRYVINALCSKGWMRVYFPLHMIETPNNRGFKIMLLSSCRCLSWYTTGSASWWVKGPLCAFLCVTQDSVQPSLLSSAEDGGGARPSLWEQDLEFAVSLQLTSHRLDLSHMAISSCEGGWEIQSFTGGKDVSSSQLYDCGRRGEWLLGENSVSLSQTSITSFDLCNSPTIPAVYTLWFPFHWWENWQLERLSDWAGEKQWVRSRVGTRNWAFGHHAGEKNRLICYVANSSIQWQEDMVTESFQCSLSTYLCQGS